MSSLGKIQNYCQLNPLKEIWIGSTYPEIFYKHFDNQTEDLFCEITEITNHDLNNLQKVLQNLGVSVVRPQFNANIDAYLDSNERLLKPPVSPCDWAITIGDTLYITPQYESGVEPFQHAIDFYVQNGQKVTVLDRSKDAMSWVTFPSVLRMGKDIFIDYDPSNQDFATNTLEVAQTLSQKYRVHLSTTGDHNDGCFCPLKPGHVFSTHYRQSYDESFPGWNIYWLDESKANGHCLQWWLPGIDYAHFNPNIKSVAEKWLGNPRETVFEVNMIVVDEKNVICAAQDDRAFGFFSDIGITPHVVDLKTCYFWDGGLHCMSSDVYRTGSAPDFWPTRDTNGIFHIKEW